MRKFDREETKVSRRWARERDRERERRMKSAREGVRDVGDEGEERREGKGDAKGGRERVEGEGRIGGAICPVC